jgi:hypothetical protein
MNPSTLSPTVYPLAYLIACIVAPFVLLVSEAGSAFGNLGSPLDGLAVLALYVPLGTVFCLVAGMPIGLVGATLVHWCCRRVRSPWVHVAAAGLVGAVGGVVYAAPVLRGIGSDLAPIHAVLAVAVAGAAGRAAAIPLSSTSIRHSPVHHD